eukprot:jgi/Hompol1/6699/HPOL_000301-RA
MHAIRQREQESLRLQKETAAVEAKRKESRSPSPFGNPNFLRSSAPPLRSISPENASSASDNPTVSLPQPESSTLLTAQTLAQSDAPATEAPAMPPAGGPPPPPPPPPTAADGTVVFKPISREPSTVTDPSSARKKKSPEELGATGPNLFALAAGAQAKSSVLTQAEPSHIPSDDWEIVEQTAGRDAYAGEPLASGNIFSSSNIMDAEVTEPKEPYRQARLLFDYGSASEGELTLQAGDMVIIEREDDEWLYCSVAATGATGWVPRNFVDMTDSSATLGRAKVMFDYDAQRSDEISVRAGAIVEIVSKDLAEWWKIRVPGEGAIGLVPANFLQEISNDEGWDSSNPFGHDGSNGAAGGANGASSSGWNQDHDAGSGRSAGTDNDSVAQSIRSMDSLRDSLDTLSTEERKRFEAVQEIIMTERSYVEDLRLTIEMFMEPLESQQLDVRKVFNNIRQILAVSELILGDLEDFATGKLKESVGEIFLKYLDDLDCYKTYCIGLGDATDSLQRIRSENASEQQASPRCKKLDLASFLLVPMQRVTRYSLLLRQMLHYTPKEHPEHESTLIALQMSDELLEKLNAATKERQTTVKVRELSRTTDLAVPEESYKLDLTTHTRILGRRLFLHEGTLFKNKSGRKLLAYLFNDMLLFVQQRPSSGLQNSLYRKPLMLCDISIREASKTLGREVGTIDACCFQIVFGDDIITLRCVSISDKRQWMNQIEAAIQAHRTAEKRALQSPLGEPSDFASAAHTIGTLEVRLLQATGIGPIERRGNKLDVFAIVQVHNQVTKSKRAPSSQPRWGQSLMFSVTSLDDVIKIALYAYDKYAKDEYLGQATVQMDILEYYVGKETGRMTLDLVDVGHGKVELQLLYRQVR